MIKIIQVEIVHGEAYLTLEYSLDGDSETRTVKINTTDVVERLLALKRLVARELTIQDLKEVLVAYVKELRLGAQRLRKEIEWQALIGINLEA